MPPPGFFGRFGIFAEERFLDGRACGDLAAEMREAQRVPATVSLSAEHIDVDYRRTAMAQVSDETRRSVEQRLREIRPSLARHFGETLPEMERTQFLVYRKGDYFRRHTDTPPNASARTDGHVRRVSIVLFVNAQGAPGEHDGYGGGQLTFYGLLGDDRRGEGIGLPLTASADLLIAFRSELVHAVTPVEHGERCTVVSWFS
jgi:predicted 2-oxoglutarate/Fe(II)-dependent dioxygenase YbiX